MITVCFPGLEVQVSEIPQPKSDGSSEPGFITDLQMGNINYLSFIFRGPV